MPNQKEPNLYDELCRMTGSEGLTQAQIAKIVCAVLQVKGGFGHPDDEGPVRLT